MTELLDTQTRGHHPDSPSSLQASEACPRFVNEERDSPAALKGTLQHKAAETGNLDILDGDEAMLDAVNKCLAYEKRVVDYFKSQNVDPLSVSEVYLSVGDDVVLDKMGNKWEGVTGGYPDKVLYSLTLGEAHVLDWKFGAIAVTPTKDNLQGIAYALGVFRLYPRIKTVTVHFFAPHQNWTEAEQENLYIHTFGRDEIAALELRIRTVIARKKDPNSKACPKVDLCIWCANKGSCTALHNAIIPLEGKYEDLVCPDVVAPHLIALPSQAAAVHKFANQVKSWSEAVKKRITDLAISEGMDVPGHVIVKRSDRVIESPGLFKAAVLKQGITPEEYEDTLTISITKVEELVKSKAPKGSGAAAVRQLTSDLQELGATVDGKPYYFLKESKSKKHD